MNFPTESDSNYLSQQQTPHKTNKNMSKLITNTSFQLSSIDCESNFFEKVPEGKKYASIELIKQSDDSIQIQSSSEIKNRKLKSSSKKASPKDIHDFLIMHQTIGFMCRQMKENKLSILKQQQKVNQLLMKRDYLQDQIQIKKKMIIKLKQFVSDQKKKNKIKSMLKEKKIDLQINFYKRQFRKKSREYRQRSHSQRKMHPMNQQINYRPNQIKVYIQMPFSHPYLQNAYPSAQNSFVQRINFNRIDQPHNTSHGTPISRKTSGKISNKNDGGYQQIFKEALQQKLFGKTAQTLLRNNPNLSETKSVKYDQEYSYLNDDDPALKVIEGVRTSNKSELRSSQKSNSAIKKKKSQIINKKWKQDEDDQEIIQHLTKDKVLNKKQIQEKSTISINFESSEDKTLNNPNASQVNVVYESETDQKKNSKQNSKHTSRNDSSSQEQSSQDAITFAKENTLSPRLQKRASNTSNNKQSTVFIDFVESQESIYTDKYTQHGSPTEKLHSPTERFSSPTLYTYKNIDSLNLQTKIKQIQEQPQFQSQAGTPIQFQTPLLQSNFQVSLKGQTKPTDGKSQIMKEVYTPLNNPPDLKNSEETPAEDEDDMIFDIKLPTQSRISRKSNQSKNIQSSGNLPIETPNNEEEDDDDIGSINLMAVSRISRQKNLQSSIRSEDKNPTVTKKLFEEQEDMGAENSELRKSTSSIIVKKGNKANLEGSAIRKSSIKRNLLAVSANSFQKIEEEQEEQQERQNPQRRHKKSGSFSNEVSNLDFHKGK